MLKQKGQGSVLQDTDFSGIGNAFKFDGISLVKDPEKSKKKKKTKKKSTEPTSKKYKRALAEERKRTPPRENPHL